MNRSIDFVIFWVDGTDPVHARKRQFFQSQFTLEKIENALQSTDNKRFVQFDELKYCLRSIKEYAPWYRNIFIITDEQIPSFLDRDRLREDRIKIIDHTTLFNNALECLPTFNSRALTTQLSQLDELSNNFILGCDDYMLSVPVSETFFFQNEQPVVYVDQVLVDTVENKSLYYDGIIKAAKLINPKLTDVYLPSHGFMALKKSRLKALASKYSEAFKNNIRHKFRHESQFLVESLFMHDCIEKEECVLKDTEMMVHFSFQLCQIGAQEKIHFLLDLLATGKRKMFCINDYESLVARFPDVKERLEVMCGVKLKSEFIN